MTINNKARFSFMVKHDGDIRDYFKALEENDDIRAKVISLHHGDTETVVRVEVFRNRERRKLVVKEPPGNTRKEDVEIKFGEVVPAPAPTLFDMRQVAKSLAEGTRIDGTHDFQMILHSLTEIPL